MSDTPFKAGETYRTRDGGWARVYATDHIAPFSVCGASLEDNEWGSSSWTADGRFRGPGTESPFDLIPPAPTPPADDLAAARAEIERLRKGLEWYANPLIYKPHPHGIGFDQRDLSYHAIAILQASPPDAKPAPERERLKGWVNVYPQRGVVVIHATRQGADATPAGDRIACIDLSQHYVGEGLEP